MSLYSHIGKFILYLETRGYSPMSINSRREHIRNFVLYLEEHGIYDVRKVNLEVLREYQRHIQERISATGEPYTSHTILTRICALRSFFRYLATMNLVLTNPAVYLKLPKVDRTPKNILSLSEMESLLSQPNLKTFIGLRDRAILEVFYSTGIRHNELVCLDIYDLNFEQETLIIRHGKGGRFRVLPLGRCATIYLQKYLDERKKTAKSDEALFLGSMGTKRIHYLVLNRCIREYVRRAGINKRVTCHTLRHTCAVHMLEGGADVRYVQELLGHRHIGNTQTYLSVSKDVLIEVHRECHPRGKFQNMENQ